MANTQSKSRVVIGIFVLVFGLLALIDNLNIFESINFIQFWPCVFIAFGIIKLQRPDRSSKFVGGGLIVLGVMLTLSYLGVVEINWREWWPVILIGVGGYIIFNARSDKDDTAGERAADNAFLDISVLMGGNKTVCNTQNFKFADVTAVMGGVELDFREASIESEAKIDVFAVWGGVIIKVPSDWCVVNRGMAIMGAIEDKTASPSASNKRLIISGTAIMGGVEVKN